MLVLIVIQKLSRTVEFVRLHKYYIYIYIYIYIYMYFILSFKILFLKV